MPQFRFQIPMQATARRIDQVAAQFFPDFSRSHLSKCIRNGALTVDGENVKNSHIVLGGENVALVVEANTSTTVQAETGEIDVVYQDEAIAVLNKPAGLVMHPGAGNQTGTLVNRVLHHFPALHDVTRHGLVHRLDKDTTGLLIVALNNAAYNNLIAQLALRRVSRQYLAIVVGRVQAGRRIENTIGRDANNRQRMAVLSDLAATSRGKYAVTAVAPLELFDGATLLRCTLHTGRTHQIRVHLHHIGFPVVGDQTYGIKRNCLRHLPKELIDFPRQALHATELGLLHPITHAACQWQVAVPQDFSTLLASLRDG